MLKTFPAIYENGILRPLKPLGLEERQLVTLALQDEDPGEFLDLEFMAEIDAALEPEPTLEQVRMALSSIPGNLSDAIREERDARG